MFEKEFPMGKETENQLERTRKLLENEKLSKLDKVSYEPKSCMSIFAVAFRISIYKISSFGIHL